jgi:hypothetical protein
METATDKHILSDKRKHAIVHDVMRLGFLGILKTFFREIETNGTHLVPSYGPCIFIVAPHANQVKPNHFTIKLTFTYGSHNSTVFQVC